MICEKLHYWNANKYTRTFLTCVSLLEWITRWLADTTNTRDTYWGCHHVNDDTDDQQWRPKWTKLESKAVLWNHSLMMMVAKNQFCGSYPNSLLCFCGLATKVIYLYCWRRQAPLTQSGQTTVSTLEYNMSLPEITGIVEHSSWYNSSPRPNSVSTELIVLMCII